MKIIGFILAISLLSNPGVKQHQPESKDLKQEIQLELDKILKENNIPGLTFAIAFEDGETWEFVSGLSDLEEETPMQIGDRMFSGSVGKMYVAPIIMMYAEQGKIDLDDPISKYLGNRSWFSDLEYAEDITIYHLLNHTSGIAEYVYSETLWKTLMGEDDPDKKWTGDDRMELLKGTESHFAPGKGWSYADTNYIVLGMIIEKISGRTYYEELQTHILDPFKLKNTSPTVTRKLRRLVSGYTGPFPLFQGLPSKVSDNEEYAVSPQFEWTGGGLVNTAEDLAIWGSILYNPDRSPLSEQSISEMLTGIDRTTGEPSRTGYGFGTEIWGNDDGEIWYGHSGFMPGFMSVVQYVPELKLAMAMQINADIFSRKLPRTVRIENLTIPLRTLLLDSEELH